MISEKKTNARENEKTPKVLLNRQHKNSKISNSAKFHGTLLLAQNKSTLKAIYNKKLSNPYANSRLLELSRQKDADKSFLTKKLFIKKKQG